MNENPPVSRVSELERMCVTLLDGLWRAVTDRNGIRSPEFNRGFTITVVGLEAPSWERRVRVTIRPDDWDEDEYIQTEFICRTIWWPECDGIIRTRKVPYLSGPVRFHMDWQYKVAIKPDGTADRHLYGWFSRHTKPIREFWTNFPVLPG